MHEGAFLMLRLSPKLQDRTEGGSRQELPAGKGIDPATGEVCAGDPSLVLNTNVALGENKAALMRAASKAVASGLGKPESYVAVAVNDGQHIIWGRLPLVVLRTGGAMSGADRGFAAIRRRGYTMCAWYAVFAWRYQSGEQQSR